MHKILTNFYSKIDLQLNKAQKQLKIKEKSLQKSTKV
jgi:uncharacterized membrane protein YciS (DUF1049 family)